MSNDNPFRGKKFDELKAKWDKKLLDSGFEDIEGKNDTLKKHSFLGRNVDEFYANEVWHKSKEEYFRLAGQFYYEHNFSSQLDKKLWEYHKDGVSVREIARILKSKNIKLTKSAVFKHLKKLIDKMLERNQHVRR